MVDPVEAAARSIAKDCGYELAFTQPDASLYSPLLNPEHWLRIARNALAASVAAALEIREAEDAGRASKS